MSTTLYAKSCQSNGQVRLERADSEVLRRQSQESNPNVKWRKDFSDYLYITDETDDDCFNPAPLCPGYCWVNSSVDENICNTKYEDEK